MKKTLSGALYERELFEGFGGQVHKNTKRGIFLNLLSAESVLWFLVPVFLKAWAKITAVQRPHLVYIDFTHNYSGKQNTLRMVLAVKEACRWGASSPLHSLYPSQVPLKTGNTKIYHTDEKKMPMFLRFRHQSIKRERVLKISAAATAAATTHKYNLSKREEKKSLVLLSHRKYWQMRNPTTVTRGHTGNKSSFWNIDK